MDMVEKVARATLDAHKYVTSWEELTPEWKEVHLRMARAAIAVMREPTDAQLAAFTRSCDSNGQCLVKYGYSAMIDAALSPKP